MRWLLTMALLALVARPAAAQENESEKLAHSFPSWSLGTSRMAKTLQLRSDATITGADGKKWNVKGSLGLFAVLLLAISALVLGLGRSDSVNARTIARLQLGMTEREVEIVLGRAPDCEAVMDREVSGRVKKYRAKQWVGPVRTVRVAFNDAGKIFTIAEGVAQPGVLDRLREWIGV
jgi:hypothetical protein